MKINTSQVIRNYNSEPIKRPPVGKNPAKDLTVLDIFDRALNTPAPLTGEARCPKCGADKYEVLTAEIKSRCYRLTNLLYSKKEIDLTLDDRHFIKERVEKVYNSPLICGRVADILEGEL